MQPNGATISTDADVIRAIQRQSLVRWAGHVLDDPASTEPRSTVARSAAATCAVIGQQARQDTDEVLGVLESRGHEVVATTVEARQRHAVDLSVDSYAAADRVAAALADVGFERWDEWTGGAAESFRRVSSELTLARTRRHSFVVRVRWRERSSRGRVARLFSPTSGDWSMVDLPQPMWWGYSLVRPVRLIAERIGRRDRTAADLGPFLSTPESLIAPLFDLVDLGPDDLLVDVGCGDGRLAIHGAVSLGCRSVGVERDIELAHVARRAAEEAEVGHLVAIEHGDARRVDLSTATVLFMFLPIDLAAGLVPETLDALPVGARLIVHEQTPLPASIEIEPDVSTAIIAPDAITVAHTWTRR